MEDITIVAEPRRKRTLLELGRINPRCLGQTTVKTMAVALDALGRPMAGIEVGVFSTVNGQLQSVALPKTDSRGRVYYDLPPGDYTVIAVLPEGQMGKNLRVPGGEVPVFVSTSQAAGQIVTPLEGAAFVAGLLSLLAGITIGGSYGTVLTAAGASAVGISAYNAVSRNT